MASSTKDATADSAFRLWRAQRKEASVAMKNALHEVTQKTLSDAMDQTWFAKQEVREEMKSVLRAARKEMTVAVDQAQTKDLKMTLVTVTKKKMNNDLEQIRLETKKAIVGKVSSRMFKIQD